MAQNLLDQPDDSFVDRLGSFLRRIARPLIWSLVGLLVIGGVLVAFMSTSGSASFQNEAAGMALSYRQSLSEYAYNEELRSMSLDDRVQAGFEPALRDKSPEELGRLRRVLEIGLISDNLEQDSLVELDILLHQRLDLPEFSDQQPELSEDEIQTLVDAAMDQPADSLVSDQLVRYYLGLVEFTTGNTGRAARYFTSVINSDYFNLGELTSLHAGISYLDADDPEAAIPHFERVINQPNDLDRASDYSPIALYYLAMAQGAHQQYDAATATLDRLEQAEGLGEEELQQRFASLTGMQTPLLEQARSLRLKLSFEKTHGPIKIDLVEDAAPASDSLDLDSMPDFSEFGNVSESEVSEEMIAELEAMAREGGLMEDPEAHSPMMDGEDMQIQVGEEPPADGEPNE